MRGKTLQEKAAARIDSELAKFNAEISALGRKVLALKAARDSLLRSRNELTNGGPDAVAK